MAATLQIEAERDILGEVLLKIKYSPTRVTSVITINRFRILVPISST